MLHYYEAIETHSFWTSKQVSCSQLKDYGSETTKCNIHLLQGTTKIIDWVNNYYKHSGYSVTELIENKILKNNSLFCDILRNLKSSVYGNYLSLSKNRVQFMILLVYVKEAWYSILTLGLLLSTNISDDLSVLCICWVESRSMATQSFINFYLFPPAEKQCRYWSTPSTS